MEDLITHIDDENGAVVRYGPVLYVVWRAHDSLATIPHADEATRALVRRYGRERKLFYVHRAPGLSSGHTQSTKTREAVMAHFDRTEPYYRASAIAIEAKGFVGAVVRSAATGVTLVRRSGVKSKVFDDARPGLRWVASLTDPETRFDADAMIEALTARQLCLPSPI